MSKRESISRYNLIIKKLRKKSATFKEIAEYLSLESEFQSYNFNISKRTFQRDIDDIRSIYNIDIQYDFSQKVYYIDFDEQPEFNERILEAFDTFNILNISDKILKHIHFEKRKPKGTENLFGLLHAIKNKLQTSFLYQKFDDEKILKRNIEPYAIKEFKNRWYVLGRDKKDNQIKNFALDRLSELEFSKIKFHIPQNFDLNLYYKYCFGVINPNQQKQQEIILSFNPHQGKYIKTLPLHESQQILIDNENELKIKLEIFITHDFFMELLSLGENVKIIKPKSLIRDLKASYKNALENYL
ncbi:MAG: WYL domain-containing protein [Bacteroidetes bacterium GWF2_35_48]|nr:MAG: WYL domain-containing protein [Bacteroidetes bacterium GWF2_35_48]